MTDWSRLHHAYGDAEDIGPLLERVAADPASPSWTRLWSALCHQGGVHPASFAALPRLARTAAEGEFAQRVEAVFLAGQIVAGEHQDHGAGDVRGRYGSAIQTLSGAARSLLAECDPARYVAVWSAVLAFEGVPGWGEQLVEVLGGEFEVDCPQCTATMFVAFGQDYGFFSSVADYALAEDAETTPLRPAEPEGLAGLGRRLYEAAVADGQPDFAATLTYVFGGAVCPSCQADFPVADRIVRDD